MNVMMSELGPESPYNFVRILTEDVTFYDNSSFVAGGVTYPMIQAKYLLACMNYGWSLEDNITEGFAKASLAQDWFSLIPDDWFAEVEHNDDGQAKIFVETLRPFVGLEPKEIKVLVVGSSSPSVAGMAYPLVAATLSDEGFSGKIDLYDPYEFEGVEVIGSMRLNHFPRSYVDSGEKYDVILDDAFARGRSVVVYDCPRVSYKCHPVGGLEEYPEGSICEEQAYYYGTEKRVLVGAGKLGPAPCIAGCDNCRSCKRVRSVLFGLLKSVGRMERVYSNLIRLGVRPCSHLPGATFISCQGEIYRRTQSGRGVKLGENFSPYDRRNIEGAVLSLISLGVVARNDDTLSRPFDKRVGRFDNVVREVLRGYGNVSCSFVGFGFSMNVVDAKCRPGDANVIFISSNVDFSELTPERVVVVGSWGVDPGKAYRFEREKNLLGEIVREFSRKDRRFK